MLCEATVHIREIGVEKIQHAAVFPHDRFEKQQRFLLHGVSKSRVEIRKDVRVGNQLVKHGQVQPLPRKVVDQCSRLRIIEHPRDLTLQHIGVAKFATFGQTRKFFVRHAAPQKVR